MKFLSGAVFGSAALVRIICPNCSHAFTPVAGAAATCPRCHYAVGGTVPTAAAGGPQFSSAQPSGFAFSPPAPQPVPVQVMPVRTTSGMAVTSMVLGIVGVVPFFFFPLIALLAVIFGVIALVLVQKSQQRGRGMAITGVVLGSLVLVMWVVALTMFAEEF